MKKILILILLLMFSVTLFAGESKATYGFEENDKYGILDNNGKVILPAEYDSIGCLKYGMVPAVKGKHAIFIKENGEIIDKKICSWHDDYSEKAENGLIPVQDCDTQKWGLLGKSGEYTVKPIYDDIFHASNNMVKAVLNKDIVYLDLKTGKKAFKLKDISESSENFGGGYAVVKKENECYFIDIKGNKSSSEYECDNLLFKFNNLFVIENKGKISVIGKNKGVLLTKDKKIDVFTKNGENKVAYIYNIRPIQKMLFDSVQEIIIQLLDNEKEKTTQQNKTNYSKINQKYDYACTFIDGENYVLKDNKEFVIDKKGNIKFERKVEKNISEKKSDGHFFSIFNLTYNKNPCLTAVRIFTGGKWDNVWSVLYKNQQKAKKNKEEKESLH